jgi:hypothetical protein
MLRACSGAMYCGEPRMTPAWVRDTSWGSWALSGMKDFTRPKSSTFTTS